MDEETVPCRLCGSPIQISSFSTKLCDSCWELESRIKRNSEIALKIIWKLGFMSVLQKTIRARIVFKFRNAFDRASYSVYCNEHASNHYKEKPCRLEQTRCWLAGFVEGWKMEKG